MRLSVTIITLNEESALPACLDSVRWADEVVVVDSGSTDRTSEIARAAGARFVPHAWEGHVRQKQFALEQASGDWILCLDADEQVSPELKAEIEATLRAPADGTDGFSMPRHTFYLGRWIDHGGWYPDRKVRLVRRGRARWTGVDPHDRLETDGRVGELSGEIHHATYRDLAHQLRTIQSFSDIAVREWRKEGRGFCLARLLFHPPAKFLACYVWKLGFLDGLPGFLIAANSAYYVFLKHAKLWEATRSRGVGESGSQEVTDSPPLSTAPIRPPDAPP